MPTASPERWGYAKAANEAWVNNTVRNTDSLNVGGQAVKVPALQRLAANAPRFAAAAIFNHPLIRTAAGVAAMLSAAKMLYDASTNTWREETPQTEKLRWAAAWGVYVSSAQEVCTYNHGSGEYGATAVMTSPTTANCVHNKDGRIVSQRTAEKTGTFSCPPGWTVTPAGCLSPAVDYPDFIEKVGATPMPQSVPNELPEGTPLPVKQPVINPTPGDNPQPQPYFVPTGNPVPNPNYDPNADPVPENQPYFQPGVRIVPSPTFDEPWRVDIQPVNRPTSSPDPKSASDLNPTPATNPDPAQDPAKNDKPKDEDKQDLCEKHPEILACQKLDEPEDKPLENKTKEISIIPDSGWGADNATCPASKVLHVQGREVSIPYDLFCTYMKGIRPIVLAMAWLTAAFILIGVRETS